MRLRRVTMTCFTSPVTKWCSTRSLPSHGAAIGGRTVATFDYPRKDDAEALAAQLKAKGKGNHFIRSVKEPMG